MLADYPELIETPLEGTEQRTKWNMRDCDAMLTIIPDNSGKSKGTELGLSEGNTLNKPMYTATSLDEVPEVKKWLESLPDNIDIAIGGPRVSECPEAYDFTKTMLNLIFN